MKKSSIILFIGLFILLATIACKKKKLIKSLYEESKASDLSLYKNKDTIYDPAGGSPHGKFKLKFNGTALANLGSDGKLPLGSSFSNGALIVKEVYTGGKLTLYAVMKKDSKSKFGANNWLWAEYDPDGKAIYSIEKKGGSCVSCHSTNTSRDLTRSFDLH